MNLLKKLFSKKEKLLCGGVGILEIKDKLNNVIGSIKYNRPNSDQKLDYIFKMQSGIIKEDSLKQISNSDNKMHSTYKIMVENICMPYAKKIFVSANGYFIDGQKIEEFDKEKQFELIKKYYGYHLVKMIEYAFEDNSILKKKF